MNDSDIVDSSPAWEAWKSHWDDFAEAFAHPIKANGLLKNSLQIQMLQAHMLKHGYVQRQNLCCLNSEYLRERLFAQLIKQEV